MPGQSLTFAGHVQKVSTVRRLKRHLCHALKVSIVLPVLRNVHDVRRAQLVQLLTPARSLLAEEDTQHTPQREVLPVTRFQQAMATLTALLLGHSNVIMINFRRQEWVERLVVALSAATTSNVPVITSIQWLVILQDSHKKTTKNSSASLIK